MKTIPKHVAIVMDGNGRWAKKRHLPRLAGHQAGVEAIRRIVKAAVAEKIAVLSLFAFSTENWRRPAEEVSNLMNLLLTALQSEVKKLHKNNICLKMIGDQQGFSKKIQESIIKAEALTANNTGMKLIIAANYGGRWDILQAVKKCVLAVQTGHLTADQIDETIFSNYLATVEFPEPDLFIRTSGEMRISNFFLWQFAYTEFYFTETLWPDFNEKEFLKALTSFTQRERRFGLTDKIKEGSRA
ncbi:MAG: di-trans,poly-cis-decaprenylcistransferase [Gammaproteobacteria bacterium RIFCSPHIGHO2_12_FULL_35_23]|nr:MAG: di-trans,poly-cis-decaprenylcistransferase [Gammaproteobacteria bacterium RIFCSPHIGHO2_12_FULL_35_23]